MRLAFAALFISALTRAAGHPAANTCAMQTPGAGRSKLHVFTLMVDAGTGKPTKSLLETLLCSIFSGSCPVVNVADIVRNPFGAYPVVADPATTYRANRSTEFRQSTKSNWFAAALDRLPENDLVMLLDGSDTAFGGCGVDHRDQQPAAFFLRTVRRRLTRILTSSNATVLFGAELNAFDYKHEISIPRWADERCPHLTRADGGGWLESHSNCNARRPHRCAGRHSMSNPNTGLVAGYVCDVRRATVAVASFPHLLRGKTDQGKFISFFFDDVADAPAAAGRARDITLDFCGELTLNMYRGTGFPLSFRDPPGSIRMENSEPLCFLHFNGASKRYPAFSNVTSFFGLHGAWEPPPTARAAL